MQAFRQNMTKVLTISLGSKKGKILVEYFIGEAYEKA